MSQEWKLDPAKTALVLIDLQNWLANFETKPHSTGEVLERSRAMADAFRAKGAPVVYIRVLLGDFLDLPADEPRLGRSDMPPEATEIAPAAGMQPGDLLIAKRHWGAFAQTTLERELRERGVDTIVLAGVATNIGVESTLRQGTGLGFGFVTVEDACATFTPEMQQFAFTAIFPRLSRVRTSQQVIEALA